MGSLYNFSKLIHKKKNLLRCIFYNTIAPTNSDNSNICLYLQK